MLLSSLSPKPSDNYSFQSRYREIHGSGKSSLISALLGEMKTLSGVANTRGKIAYVPQQAKFSIHKLSMQNQLHFVANVYAVLPVSTVKCLYSRGREWEREEGYSKDQSIKLIQVFSTSDFHEYWWNDIVFIFFVPSTLCRASEASNIDSFKH